MIQATLLIGLVLAQVPEEHRIGRFSISFKERHPLTDLKDLCRRQGWKIADVKKAEPELESLKIEDVAFEVAVPETYAPEKSFGLLVWISPSDSGTPPEEWIDVLAAKNLVFIGAHNSGNARGVAYRLGFALDAVHNITKRYSIDKSRIYVTGFSGGGRTASRAGIAYPDVFTGGIYQGGMDFYRAVPDPADAKREFPPMFVKPEGDLFRKVKSESRHVVLVGQKDFNRPSAKAIFEVMVKKEQFARATYLEMPGKEHEPADAAALGKAIDALDAPLKAKK